MPSPSKPAPMSDIDIGSGAALGPLAATFPVLPLFPTISEAKKNPPLLAIKLAMVTPPADVTVNDSGPGGLPAWPPWQDVQLMDSRNIPNPEAVSGAGPMAKPSVMLPITIGPTTLNSRASPAPVPANLSLAANVSVTVTKVGVVWANEIVPNGEVPHVPVQAS